MENNKKGLKKIWGLKYAPIFFRIKTYLLNRKEVSNMGYKVTTEKIYEQLTSDQVYEILKRYESITDEIYANLKFIKPEFDYGYPTGRYTVVFESNVSSTERGFMSLCSRAEDELMLLIDNIENKGTLREP